MFVLKQCYALTQLTDAAGGRRRGGMFCFTPNQRKYYTLKLFETAGKV